jgi:universal stress protein E
MHRVLVANDSLQGLQAALNEAAALVAPDATLLLLETLYDPIAEEPAEVLPRQEQARLMEALKAAERNALQRLADACADAGSVAVESRLVWAKDAAGHHHPLAGFFHTPLDWALMRTSRCPVLISRSSAAGDAAPAPAHAGGPVLAAIDAADEAHAALSREILRTAARLAAPTRAPLHLVTAYPDLGQRFDELQVASDFRGLKRSMRESRRNTLSGLCAELEINAAEIHVLEGRAGPVIARLADALQPRLTVLGTAARRGLAKLVIGNTAEDLMSRLPGDLVSVREPWS